ncbi:MAG: addiction module protein [bacterium]|nr:addiction module protein [bacterium]
MNGVLQHLVDDLMALPLATRAILAEKLVESVDDYAGEDVQRAWHAEIARRVEAYESGKVATLGAEAVMNDARKVLDEVRRVSS